MQNSNKQSAICVYHLNSETAIQFINKKTSVWLCSNTTPTGKSRKIMNDANLYWHTSYNELIDYQTLNDTILKLPYWYYHSGYWSTNKSKGLLINSNSYLPRIPADTLHLDYIFVSGNPTFTINEISDKITFNKVIIDGSVPYWKVNNFKCSGKYPPVHLTKKDGAFIHQETM